MKFDKSLADTDTRSTETRTATTLSKIANSIEPHIQFTVDSPELNADKRVAVLDLKLWIETQWPPGNCTHFLQKGCSFSIYYFKEKCTFLPDKKEYFATGSLTQDWKCVQTPGLE